MPDGKHKFATTHWSLVLAAGDFQAPGSRAALGELAEAYWYPLYAFARRRGHDAEDAADLVQGFFARLLETSGLGTANPERGRFRSFLLGAFKHFISNERDRTSALKRGGGALAISLDAASAEARYDLEPADPQNPERIFERRWALAVLDRGLARLRREHRAAGKEASFEELKSFLAGTSERGTVGEAAARLGMSDGAARVAVHRLRRRFGELLRTEIAATVASSEQIEDELRFLLAALER